MIAKVEPLTPARSLRGPFDYRLGVDLPGVGVGSMLVVPFGRRRLLGVVVGMAEESELPPERLAEPLRALEAQVPGRAGASRPLARPGVLLGPGTRAGARSAAGHGHRQRPPRCARGAPCAWSSPTPGASSLAEEAARLGARQQAALRALAAGPVGAADLGRATGCDHGSLRGLERRGPGGAAPGPGAGPPAADRRRGRLRGRRSGAHAGPDARPWTRWPRGSRPADPGTPLLLDGVTGSGKTEVYLRSVAMALERGRSAIVLVPEIALTPQTAGRFVERFGDSVAVMHSQLAPRERYDEWWRMRTGEARVCVGPRSAIFAPFADLGLIVIDEEHDASYKQEGDPRYDARVVAERRAREEGAVLLAGSATPRPESIVRYHRLTLPQPRGPPPDAPGGAGGHARACRARSTSARAPPWTRCAAARRRRSCC